MGNRLFLSGHLAFDPEVKDHNGKKFVRFRVITNEGYKKRDTQEWVDRSMSHDLIVSDLSGDGKGLFGYITRNGQKGRWCEVEGKLHYREYKKDGEASGIYVASIVVDGVTFPIGDRRKDAEPDGASA